LLRKKEGVTGVRKKGVRGEEGRGKRGTHGRAVDAAEEAAAAVSRSHLAATASMCAKSLRMMAVIATL
jgi:hypothetical protein